MPDALRTATPMGDWRTFPFTVADSDGVLGIKDARLEGESYLYLVEDTVGAALESADFGDEAILIYHAEKIMVPKMVESLYIFLPGARVYWDPVTRLVTPTFDSGYFWIGIATEPAAADDAYVEIDLDGGHAEVEAVLP
jgi:predicted RecA/RadA family phage recombinase